MDPKRWGLLLVNLGTPDAPDRVAVARYLREFLLDPRVLDVPSLVRQFLVRVLIVPRRAPESAAAYRSIWQPAGSPLLTHGQALVERLRDRLPDVPVELAMRYQNPSIASGLQRLRDQGIDRVVVFPLFPQNSSAAWSSAVEKVFVEASRLWDIPALHVVPPFYDHPAFIRAFASVARPVIDSLQPDKTILSFHGLPERHVIKSDATGGAHCLRVPGCCDAICDANRNCYRAQCFATARGIAAALDLADGTWEVTFQSRLGRDPWIQPYTDVRLEELPKEGVRRVAILSPAFVADCLETLEELAMRADEDFRKHGGEALQLVPSLNSEDVWVDGVLEILRDSAPFG